MPKTSLISVVLPTHNRRNELQKALASLFVQTVKPYEIIVVDDGSIPKVTDDIFSNSPCEIKTLLIRNELPKGAPHARNRGIEAASSQWIAFLDDDDEFKPDKIEKVARHIQDNPECDLVYHPAEIHMVNEGITYTTKPRQFSSKDDIFRNMLIKNEIGGTPMVIAKKSILIEAGKFKENIPALQDYELWLRVARITTNLNLLALPLTTCHYKTQKKSISKSLLANKKAIHFVEIKYSPKYITLTDTEIKRHTEWKSSMLVHKSILNGNILSALGYQFKQFLHSPSPHNFLALFAILAGPKCIYRIKARLG